MAPEIYNKIPFDRRPLLGIKSDVWALGVLFYKMMEGHYPFKIEKIASKVFVFRNQKLVFSSTIRKKHKTLIKGMIRIVPEKRLSVDQVFGKL